MSDVIRFRIPATRDCLIRVYEPLVSPFGNRSSALTKYLVPAYESEIDPSIAAKLKLWRKNRREQDTPLRAYADTFRRPEVKVSSVMLAVLCRTREEIIVRNLSLDHMLDGLHLWAEAELREISEEARIRMRELYHEFTPAVKLHLNFVEVPNQ